MAEMPAAGGHPLIFIVGCGRSGTTLLLQWLAATGCFGYPSNLLSRFYAAPYLGVRIQQLLTDPRYSFNDELAELRGVLGFESRLGKTKGPLAPNEFWYFWRRFIDFPEIHPVSESALMAADGTLLRSELVALTRAFDRPLAMKALIMNWNLGYLADLLDRAIFLFINRDPVLNAQSLLKARRDYFGTDAAWYSFKPPEYGDLADRSPAVQAVGQVVHTNTAIRRQLAVMSPDRWLELRYEDFCAEPAAAFAAITERLEGMGAALASGYVGPDRFEPQTEWHLGEDTRREMDRALAEWGQSST